MRKILMATVVLPLALGQAGAALAQSSTPAFQNSGSAAQRGAGNSQASAELFYMIQQLQEEVRRLRGQVEEQGYQIDRLQKQGRDRYIDLDQRILALSEKMAEQPVGSSSSASSSGGASAPVIEEKEYRQPDAEERAAYAEIQDLIRNQKDYDTAINKIYAFIDTYPEGDLTVNAYYWLGEVYLVKPQLEQAKQAFTIVATRYPDHRKAPDALYKLGVTLDKLGETEQARGRMQNVVDSYPDSSAAKLARKFLGAG
ncbi:tol-pal system protein YbgF [Marinobacter salinisoli]|uniref:Cell division coordinator CpoB n=1 Tax=Marinobacter salinisoli TaxID=2769486 RepID=A0ABX7MN67_9GAMM|nr:tol-pal system protein YbgF [Marinobacter salinisoli]QSP93643.1 tol-pal system protein YbgF [Marinobacter salinisoli]